MSTSHRRRNAIPAIGTAVVVAVLGAAAFSTGSGAATVSHRRVPTGARRLVVTDDVLGRRQGPLTYTSAGTIARVAGLIDGLPTAPRGVRACPLDTGAVIRLTFAAARAAGGAPGSKPLAVAMVDPTGCGDVMLTVRGKRQPALSGYILRGPGGRPSRSFVSRLDSVLHVTLATGLPSNRHLPVSPAMTGLRP
jgi:hypothetical protein